MQEFRKNIKGRGASSNTSVRFEAIHFEAEPQDWDGYDEERPLLRTEFLRDSSRSVLSENKSPDIGFRFSVNPALGGKLNDAHFGSRMRRVGPLAAHLEQMFNVYSRREGLNREALKLSTEHFLRPSDQMTFSY